MSAQIITPMRTIFQRAAIVVDQLKRIERLRMIGLDRQTIEEFIPLLMAFGSTRSEVEMLMGYVERARTAS